VALARLAPGHYRGRVHIGDRQGLFRLRPLGESSAFPETGLYRPESETTTYGNNPGLLKQIASYSGGLYNPEPPAVFRSTGQAIPSTLRLWPGLLGLAILLNLAELIVRKGGAIWSAFVEWRGTRMAVS
jgi:hypothetical protein